MERSSNYVTFDMIRWIRKHLAIITDYVEWDIISYKLEGLSSIFFRFMPSKWIAHRGLHLKHALQARQDMHYVPWQGRLGSGIHYVGRKTPLEVLGYLQNRPVAGDLHKILPNATMTSSAQSVWLVFRYIGCVVITFPMR